MPEKTSKGYREKSYRLADAERNGQIITAHCNLCHLTFNYRPADLIAFSATSAPSKSNAISVARIAGRRIISVPSSGASAPPNMESFR
jgi:hypothetical protein